MPQNFGQAIARLFGVKAAPPNQLSADQFGALVFQGALHTHLDITAPTVIFTGTGRITKVSVIVAGTGVGTINDAVTTGAAAIANQIGSISDAATGIFNVDMPVTNGLVIVPGTGQTVSVSYYH